MNPGKPRPATDRNTRNAAEGPSSPASWCAGSRLSSCAAPVAEGASRSWSTVPASSRTACRSERQARLLRTDTDACMRCRTLVGRNLRHPEAWGSSSTSRMDAGQWHSLRKAVEIRAQRKERRFEPRQGAPSLALDSERGGHRPERILLSQRPVLKTAPNGLAYWALRSMGCWGPDSTIRPHVASSSPVP